MLKYPAYQLLAYLAEGLTLSSRKHDTAISSRQISDCDVAVCFVIVLHVCKSFLTKSCAVAASVDTEGQMYMHSRAQSKQRLGQSAESTRCAYHFTLNVLNVQHVTTL